jgi:hypothetical protein
MRLESHHGEKILPAQIVEVVRAEISAAKTIRKTVLVNRVCTRLQLTADSQQNIKEVIATLITRKEILVIDQGLVSISPIRIILLSPTRVAVLSSLPTSRLEVLLGQPIMGDENRSINVDGNTLKNVVDGAGGLLITVESYAAISSETVADDRWLDQLKKRQLDVMSKGSIIETPESYRWYQKQWLSFENALADAGLWRGENINGKSLFIWSTKADLIGGKGLKLTGSDARRTLFALDRVAGHTHKMSYSKIDDGYNISLDSYLPINEYKALSCFSYAQDSNDRNLYSIYEDCFEKFSELLETQLGIELVEEV